MQVTFNDKHEWSLNGCLWISQDNSKPKTKCKVAYLSNGENTDDKIPREFKRHWKPKSGIMETVRKFRDSISKVPQPQVEEPKEDIEMMLQSQKWESMQEITYELDRVETGRIPRKSL